MEDLIKEAKEHVLSYGYKGLANHTIIPALMAEFATIYHNSQLEKLNGRIFSFDDESNCNHEWILNHHRGTKYCRKGCDGFKTHAI